MKAGILIGAIAVAMGSLSVQAQSMTGGQSGGSTASTGAGYYSGQTVNTPTSNVNSMTVTAVGSGMLGIVPGDSTRQSELTSSGSPRGVDKATRKENRMRRKQSANRSEGAKSQPPR